MNRLLIGVAAAALSAVIGSGPSYAAALTGQIFQNAGDAGNTNDRAGNITGPHANFAPGLINYDSNVTGYTPAQFLNNPTFTSPSAGFNSAASLNNAFIEITGTIGLLAGNNSFVLGHDDGAILDIAGITGAANASCTGANAGAVLCQPAPTSFTTSPFNVFNPGAAGNFNFTLDYTECCGPPAELLFTVNNVNVGTSVPEPASLAIFGAALAGLGLIRRRRNRNAAA